MTWRVDEFEGRPELSKKRAMVLLIEGFIAFVIVGFLVIGVGLQLIQGAVDRDTRDRIVDCTAPEGKCYQEGQKRSTELLGLIFQDNQSREDITRSVILAAVACAQDPKNDNYKKMQVCVDDLLKESAISGDG